MMSGILNTKPLQPCTVYAGYGDVPRIGSNYCENECKQRLECRKLGETCPVDKPSTIDDITLISRETTLLLLNKFGSVDRVCEKAGMQMEAILMLIDYYGLNSKLSWN